LKLLTTLTIAVIFALPEALLATPVKNQAVSYKSGDETVTVYLVTPDSAGRHPAIVVIHEWWGLVPWVKEQADKFAEQGYVALAVDLYHGKSASDPNEAHELMRGLPQDRAVRDLKAAFDYLASGPEVDLKKIGSVGWCMGGGYSLLLAENEPTLAACVVNYGAMPTDPATIAKIQAPVLGNFGGLDHGITPDAVHAFENSMKADGKTIDAKVYGDAGHGFQNPNNKAEYHKDDAADAWSRMVTFFQAHLK
jgi:carboxymethylenebutenolidase